MLISFQEAEPIKQGLQWAGLEMHAAEQQPPLGAEPAVGLRAGCGVLASDECTAAGCQGAAGWGRGRKEENLSWGPGRWKAASVELELSATLWALCRLETSGLWLFHGSIFKSTQTQTDGPLPAAFLT